MGRKPQTNDYSLLYERAARERGEARADAARWKAEAERLRKGAGAALADLRAGSPAVARAVLVATLHDHHVSAGGGTDA